MRMKDLEALNSEFDVCGLSVYDGDEKWVRRTWSRREKGWQPVTVSLVNMVLKKVAQLVVKLLERAESKGVGISKLPLALGSVWMDLLDGGADVVFVASP